MSDPREILGLGEDATPEQINSAYWKALRRLHPDTGSAAEARGGPTLADLQAARKALHQRAARSERTDVRVERPEVSTDLPPVPARVPVRRWAQDVIAGPVRYHGPSSGHR